jgi:hypothetical protein
MSVSRLMVLSGRGFSSSSVSNMRFCYVPGCSDKVWANGLCRFHDQRQRTGIPLTKPRGFRSLEKKGWIDKLGYKWVMVAGKDVLEHRYIVETALGRKLTIDETIHHINGIKVDNRWPENLEVLHRAFHTSHHRGHQSPCQICGILKRRRDGKGFEGAKGLCAKHYQQLRAGKLPHG